MRTVRIEVTAIPWDETIAEYGYRLNLPDRAEILSVELRKGGGVIVTWTLEP